MQELLVSKNEEGWKLKKLCFQYFKDVPNSYTYKMLRKKNILLNGGKASGDEILKMGDKVQIYISDESLKKLREEGSKAGELPKLSDYKWLTPDRVLYETEDWLILDKPSGVLSQKGKPGEQSVNDAVIAYLLDKGSISEKSLELFRPSVCNRLDRNTSGIISASKTRKGARELTDYYRAKDGRSAGKYYLTIVHGNCTLKGHFDRLEYVKSNSNNQAYVWMIGGKRPPETMNFGKSVIIWTDLTPLSYNREKDVTLMLCRLHTGRSHQIRVTMQHYGYHVVGDPKYGNPVRDHFLGTEQTGQLLLAFQLKLPDGKVVQAGVPQAFLGYFPNAEQLAIEKIKKI